MTMMPAIAAGTTHRLPPVRGEGVQPGVGTGVDGSVGARGGSAGRARGSVGEDGVAGGAGGVGGSETLRPHFVQNATEARVCCPQCGHVNISVMCFGLSPAEAAESRRRRPWGSVVSHDEKS